ncbi:MAG TPA: hypothetical protein VE077_15650 [Candidatus Methylomirabilis sp.]|nr:hypothetical protein [Candidatus Methylomirabilis sp.]
MSTEHHKAERGGGQPLRHSDVSFEAQDINARTILKYLLGLAVCVILAFAVSVYVFKFATGAAVGSESQLTPSHRNIGPTMPPEPRLQGVPGHTNDPQLDLRIKMQQDTEANERLVYVDKQAGIAQIPVEDAMRIIVSKGLPAVPTPVAEKKR